MAADALSCRVHTSEEELVAISSSIPLWLQEVISAYDGNDMAQKLLTELAIQTSNESGYSRRAGIIYHRNKIWLAHSSLLQHKVMQALYDSATGGHSSFPVTFRCIHQLFIWPGMKSDIKKFVQECPTCQQAKPERVRYPGLLQPLPVPTQAWQVVSMDFIEGLPRSSSYNCILVVVDKLSKYAHF
uniref:Integrase zinc-binding domain-containing protein n=1 Tax=Arundo donax TaxID=35708 RepID=A0A0A9AHV8_ARUDO